MCLGINDLIFGLAVIIHHIMMFVMGYIICTSFLINEFLLYFFYSISGVLILGATTERYFFITRKSFYNRCFTSTVFRGYIVMGVILGLGYSTVLITGHLSQNPKTISYILLTLGFNTIVVLLGATILNFALIHHIKRSEKRINNMNCNASRITSSHSRATYTIILISFVLVMACFCAGFNLLYLGFTGLHNPLVFATYYVTYGNWIMVPVFLYSAINSFIYLYRNEKIMKLYKRIYKSSTSIFTTNDSSGLKSKNLIFSGSKQLELNYTVIQTKHLFVPKLFIY